MKRSMDSMGVILLLTRLGFSAAFPPAVFVLGALQIKNRFGLGGWVLAAGIVLGFAGAVEGFVSTLRAADILLKKTDRERKEGHDDLPHIHHS